jgi:hypothetical protein
MSMITILMLLLMMMHALVVAFNPAGRQSHRKGIRIRFRRHQQQDKNREEKAPPPPPPSRCYKTLENRT